MLQSYEGDLSSQDPLDKHLLCDKREDYTFDKMTLSRRGAITMALPKITKEMLEQNQQETAQDFFVTLEKDELNAQDIWETIYEYYTKIS